MRTSFFRTFHPMMVGLGLWPLIFTLVCIHLFSPAWALGIGLFLSVGIVVHQWVRYRTLNLFLFYTILILSILLPLRVWGGEVFVPRVSIAPAIEIYMALCVFINITNPTFFNELLRRFNLHLSNYLFECRLIWILSLVHFCVRVVVVISEANPLAQFGTRFNSFVPVAIYLVTIGVNFLGLRMAWTEERKMRLRVAPVWNGQIYLVRRGNVWDLPLEVETQAAIDDTLAYIRSLIAHHLGVDGPFNDPRLLTRYEQPGASSSQILTGLYLLPLIDELPPALQTVSSEAAFFAFDSLPEALSPTFQLELGRLQWAAEMWKQFGTPT